MGIMIKMMETDEEKKGKSYVHWKSWHEAYEGILKSDYLDKLTLEKCIEMTQNWFSNTFIAIDQDNNESPCKVVGFSCFCDHGNEAPDEGEVTAIYVLSDYYGTGVGKKLMDAALDKLKAYSIQEVRVFKDNIKAIKFYKKYGFEQIGDEEYLEGLGAAVIKMTRQNHCNE